MKKLFYIFIFFGVSFVGNHLVLAESCDSSDIARFKALASLVDVHYEYLGKFENKDNADFMSEKYRITISGINDDILVGVNDGGKEEILYGVKDLKDGVFSFETFLTEYKFNVYGVGCLNSSVRTIAITLPRYNIFADDDRCLKLEKYHLDVCDKWYQGSLDYKHFLEITNQYMEEEVSTYDQVLNFIKKYYVFIGVGIVLFLVIIIFLILRHRKRSVLE